MSHHPDTELLRLYASGAIDTAHGAAIASHLDSCPHCRNKVTQFESEAAEQMIAVSNAEQKSSKELELVFAHMLDDITTLDADYSKPRCVSPAKSESMVRSLSSLR